jgi:hypothetical protein
MKFDDKFIINIQFHFNIYIMSSVNLVPEQNMNFHVLGMAVCYWFNAAKMPLSIKLYSQNRESNKTVRSFLTPYHAILHIHVLKYY